MMDKAKYLNYQVLQRWGRQVLRVFYLALHETRRVSMLGIRCVFRYQSETSACGSHKKMAIRASGYASLPEAREAGAAVISQKSQPASQLADVWE